MELEKRVARLEALIEQAGIAIPGEEPAEDELFANPGDGVGFSGLIEVEAGAAREKDTAGDKTYSSDVVLATVELGFDAQINEHFGGNLVLLWEEDDTEPIAIDEGTITYENESLSITGGRFYQPFGTFNSVFISDPPTLELAETQESGVMAGIGLSGIASLSLSLANGDVDEASAKDKLNDFGARIDFNIEDENGDATDAALYYYSDIADTDADLLGASASGAGTAKTVGGWGADLSLSRGSFGFILEYISAARDFDIADTGDPDGDGAGEQPAAWNLELTFDLSDTHTLALKYEGTDEMAGLPESGFGIFSGWDLGDGIGFGLEYMYGSFDQSFSALKRRHALTSQVSLEF